VWDEPIFCLVELDKKWLGYVFFSVTVSRPSMAALPSRFMAALPGRSSFLKPSMAAAEPSMVAAVKE
jgi:hypothetical protein